MKARTLHFAPVLVGVIPLSFNGKLRKGSLGGGNMYFCDVKLACQQQALLFTFVLLSHVPDMSPLIVVLPMNRIVAKVSIMNNSWFP